MSSLDVFVSVPRDGHSLGHDVFHNFGRRPQDPEKAHENPILDGQTTSEQFIPRTSTAHTTAADTTVCRRTPCDCNEGCSRMSLLWLLKRPEPGPPRPCRKGNKSNKGRHAGIVGLALLLVSCRVLPHMCRFNCIWRGCSCGFACFEMLLAMWLWVLLFALCLICCYLFSQGLITAAETKGAATHFTKDGNINASSSPTTLANTFATRSLIRLICFCRECTLPHVATV
jgi:hypothetical protein